MAGVSKSKLSGSTDGRPILVTATASPGTLIHTSVTGTTAGTFDEIWLYATNGNTADLVMTIELGGVAGSDAIIQTIPFKNGRYLVIDGAILQNGTIVRCYAGTGSVSSISGFVNTITA